MSPHHDTIAAPATPAGTSAIAVVRISGPDTKRLVAAIAGSTPPPRHARHVDYRSIDGRLLDDVLITFFQGPRSYTGEDTAEISCHGNPFIAQSLLEDLFARGCRPAAPGEFTQRAFLNGRMDLSQAEAVMDVISARSERALTMAQQQLRGALTRRMSGLVDGLLGVLARVEAYIDFPDEDLPQEDRHWVASEIQRLQSATGKLLATSHYGEVLRGGLRTLIVGRPNVGKSSLLNRLVGYERALVCPEPGTTRDFIEERLVAGPHSLRLMDTAGLNPTPAALEKLGMDKTLERVADADLFLVVIDSTDADAGVDPAVRNRLSPQNTVVVFNKTDLAPTAPLPAWTSEFRHVRVSAATAAGVDDLIAQVVQMADGLQTTVGDELIAVSARHAHALQEAGNSLAAATNKLQEGGPVELLASDLRAALEAYGEIAGKVDNERMLDQLFATFCIGK